MNNLFIHKPLFYMQTYILILKFFYEYSTVDILNLKSHSKLFKNKINLLKPYNIAYNNFILLYVIFYTYIS